jgi:hypothetical protein
LLIRINLSTKEIERFIGHSDEIWIMILEEEKDRMISTGYDYKVILWCLRTRTQLGYIRTSGKYNQALILINPLETLIVGDDRGNLTKFSTYALTQKKKA